MPFACLAARLQQADHSSLPIGECGARKKRVPRPCALCSEQAVMMAVQERHDVVPWKSVYTGIGLLLAGTPLSLPAPRLLAAGRPLAALAGFRGALSMPCSAHHRSNRAGAAAACRRFRPPASPRRPQPRLKVSCTMDAGLAMFIAGLVLWQTEGNHALIGLWVSIHRRRRQRGPVVSMLLRVQHGFLLPCARMWRGHEHLIATACRFSACLSSSPGLTSRERRLLLPASAAAAAALCPCCCRRCCCSAPPHQVLPAPCCLPCLHTGASLTRCGRGTAATPGVTCQTSPRSRRTEGLCSGKPRRSAPAARSATRSSPAFVASIVILYSAAPVRAAPAAAAAASARSRN